MINDLKNTTRLAMIINTQHHINLTTDFTSAIHHNVPTASVYIVRSLSLKSSKSWVKSPCIHSHLSRPKSLHSVDPPSNSPRYCNIVGVSWWQGVGGGISLCVQQLQTQFERSTTTVKCFACMQLVLCMCVHVSGRLIVGLFCKRMFSKIHVYAFSAASYKPIVFAKNIVLLCNVTLSVVHVCAC